MTDKSQKLVAYFRVSTASQGIDGLGIEAQRTAVNNYARANASTIIATYTEVESGKRADRPELARAMAHARRSKAILCVAKMDRLARNVAFLSALMDSGVNFIACDNPHANRLTVHILAAVAEAEALAISARTKAALAVVKARGTKLGSARPGHWKGREHRREAGRVKAIAKAATVIRQRAREAYADLVPEMQRMRANGHTLQQIADELTAQGHTTRTGKRWSHVPVLRVLSRFAS